MMTKYIWIPLKFDAAQITVMHYWFGQAFFYFQVSCIISLLQGWEGEQFLKETLFIVSKMPAKSQKKKKVS